MQFDGEQFIPRPPEQIWPKLSDAAFLVGALSGVETVRADPDSAVWKIRPALAFASGPLDITLTITSRTPPSEMHTTLVSKGIGATSTVTTKLVLAAADGGTRIHWTAQITELTGLLKMVPKGLIQSSARKVIEDVWKQVGERLGKS